MGKKTYAQLPNGKVMNWTDILEKYHLDHIDGASAHTEFDVYALTKKKLQEIVVVMKNDNGEFVEAVQDKYGTWDIPDSKNNSNDDNEEDEEEINEEKRCDICGDLINDCKCEKDEYNNDIYPWDADDEGGYPKGKGTLFFHLCHEDDNSKILLYESKNGNKLIDIEPKDYIRLNLHSWKEYILDPGKYSIIIKRNNIVVLNKFVIVYKKKRTTINDLDYINFKGNVNGTGKLNVTSINKETGIRINKDFIGHCPKSLNLKPGSYIIEFWNYSDNRKLKKLYKENSFTKNVNVYESKITNVDENYDENKVQKLEEQKLRNERLEQERLRDERSKKEEKEKLRLEELEQQKERFRQEDLKQERLKRIEEEKKKFDQEVIENERKVLEQRNERLQNHSYVPESNGLRYPYGTYNKHGHGNGNGDKKITRARLPNGDVIQWTELLRQLNLFHKGGSAYVNWLEHKRKDINRLLPDVDRIDEDGNIVPEKEPRKIISRSDHDLNWIRYFGKEEQGLCPCCVDVRNITIHKSWFIDGHNIPHSKGGTEDLENLVPICKLCNDGMSDKYTIAEYRERMLKPKIV